jgi:hypothetical protein
MAAKEATGPNSADLTPEPIEALLFLVEFGQHALVLATHPSVDRGSSEPATIRPRSDRAHGASMFTVMTLEHTGETGAPLDATN